MLALCALLITSSVVAFAAPGPAEHEYQVETIPETIFVQSDFTLDLYTEEGETMNLPDVDWPEIEGSVEAFSLSCCKLSSSFESRGEMIP